MKNILLLLACILLVGVVISFPLASSRAEEPDKTLTKEIAEILADCKKIAPGSTRAELSRVFTTEGGLSTVRQRTFVHRRCPHIKVDVGFTLLEEKQQDERASDVVSKISRPYLEWSVAD